MPNNLISNNKTKIDILKKNNIEKKKHELNWVNLTNPWLAIYNQNKKIRISKKKPNKKDQSLI
jgi:hypothetical protein